VQTANRSTMPGEDMLDQVSGGMNFGLMNALRTGNILFVSRSPSLPCTIARTLGNYIQLCSGCYERTAHARSVQLGALPQLTEVRLAARMHVRVTPTPVRNAVANSLPAFLLRSHWPRRHTQRARDRAACIQQNCNRFLAMHTLARPPHITSRGHI
jgi:hypothetical protein